MCFAAELTMLIKWLGIAAESYPFQQPALEKVDHLVP
jgi:hypothetical protein